MVNDAYKVIGAVIALATLSVVLAKQSQTSTVFGAFFNGFNSLISAAGSAGNGTSGGSSPTQRNYV